MKTFDGDRVLVPPWLTLPAAERSGELGSASTLRVQRSLSDRAFLIEKVAAFERECSLVAAHELVSAAAVAQDHAIARPAAQLLADSTEVPRPLHALALDVLHDRTARAPAADEDTKEAVRIRRRWLVEHPRDAVRWTELAFFYCALGQNEKAGRCVKTALALAPSSRYILRSSTRYYLHTHEPERAIFLLERSQAFAHDPWLAAARLALLEVVGKRPTKMRRVRSLLQADFADRSLSELRAAIASLEYREGSLRRARRLFLASLKDPTANVLAQINWYRAKGRLTVTLEPTTHTLDHSHEARVWAHVNAEEWKKAASACWQWAEVEPYSTRPYILGSYWSCVTEDDPKSAKEFSEAGMNANPGNPLLLNNVAFSYGRLGELDRGQDSYQKAMRALRALEDQMAASALEGLWAYRQGNVAQGRACYAKALHMCSPADQSTRLRLALHWIEEEVDAAIPGASQAAQLVTNTKRAKGEADVEVMRARIRGKAMGVPNADLDADMLEGLRAGGVIQ